MIFVTMREKLLILDLSCLFLLVSLSSVAISLMLVEFSVVVTLTFLHLPVLNQIFYPLIDLRIVLSY